MSEHEYKEPNFEDNSHSEGDHPAFEGQAEPADEIDFNVDPDAPDVDPDVEIGAADDEDAEVVPPQGSDKAPTDPKAAKAKKESTRPPVPEGFISPVQFAKLLGEHLTAKARETNPEAEAIEVRPQVVYSYIKNNDASSKNPFPCRTDVPGRAIVLKADEGLAWWDEKNARVAKSKADRAAAAAAKAKKAETSPQAAAETGEVATGQVEEVE